MKSKNELVSCLTRNGATHEQLMNFCEDYREKYHNELCWAFPISDGKHLGTFIVLVREGALSLPYDEADAVDGEIFCLDDIRMFCADDMADFIESWQLFDSELQRAMESLLLYLKNVFMKEISRRWIRRKYTVFLILICLRIIMAEAYPSRIS